MTDDYITNRFDKFDADQKEWLATRIGKLTTSEKEIMNNEESIARLLDSRPAIEKIIEALQGTEPHLADARQRLRLTIISPEPGIEPEALLSIREAAWARYTCDVHNAGNRRSIMVSPFEDSPASVDGMESLHDAISAWRGVLTPGAYMVRIQ